MKGVFSMNDEIYERLAEVLDRLPNGFPRTPSNVEIQMLKKLFTPEEARLAASMTKEYESVEKIASRFGMEEKKLQHILIEMAKRWQVLLKKEERKLYFRLAPFIVGIYEGHLERIDHEFAHLFEEYMYDGGAVGIMKPLPALHRVVPAQGSVKSEWILPYEDVRRMLEEAKAFGVRECICRKQQDLVGKRKCDFPLLN
jgi:electron transport complex protein RnfB